MKNGLKRLFFVVLITVMMITVLSGCGPKKPEPEEAQAYVKAVIDLMCTGDYDHDVELADIEEGKESETRDALIEKMVTEFSSESNLSDEVTGGFRELITKALGKTKYTVGEAVATDDNGYDVTVTVEPLQIYTGINEELDEVLAEKVAAEPDKILAMTEEEQTNYVMEIVLELLNKRVEDPKYDPPEEVVVHYGPMEGNDHVYGCEESEGKKLGAKLFSDSGL